MAKDRPSTALAKSRSELAQISQIEHAIDKATDIRQLKQLADASEAFRVCAKKAGLGHAAACRGWRAKALATRRGGAMLANMRPQYSTSESPTSMY